MYGRLDGAGTAGRSTGGHTSGNGMGSWLNWAGWIGSTGRLERLKLRRLEGPADRTCCIGLGALVIEPASPRFTSPPPRLRIVPDPFTLRCSANKLVLLPVSQSAAYALKLSGVNALRRNTFVSFVAGHDTHYSYGPQPLSLPRSDDLVAKNCLMLAQLRYHSYGQPDLSHATLIFN